VPEAERRHRDQRPEREARGHPAFASGPAGEQQGRGRSDADGQDRQAIEADEGSALHQPEILAERHP
jgi:hypothetical protein